jgi:hypothetical protein
MPLLQARKQEMSVSLNALRVTKAKAEERVEREKFEIESLVERIQATAALNARNKRSQKATRDLT